MGDLERGEISQEGFHWFLWGGMEAWTVLNSFHCLLGFKLKRGHGYRESTLKALRNVISWKPWREVSGHTVMKNEMQGNETQRCAVCVWQKFNRNDLIPVKQVQYMKRKEWNKLASQYFFKFDLLLLVSLSSVMNAVNSSELDAFKKKHTLHKSTLKAAMDKFRSVSCSGFIGPSGTSWKVLQEGYF